MTPSQIMKARLQKIVKQAENGKQKWDVSKFSEQLNIPLNETKNRVLSVMKDSIDIISNEIEADIVCGVRYVILKEFVDTALSRKDTVKKWPIYIPIGRIENCRQSNDPFSNEQAPWYALWMLRTSGGISPELMGIDWPPDVTYREVALWVKERVPEYSRWADLSMGGYKLHPLGLYPDQETVRVAEPGDSERGFRVVPPGGLALLYLAEKAALNAKPSPFTHMLVPADRQSVHAATTLNGANPRDRKKGKAQLNEELEEPIVEITWDDGKPQRLEIPYHGGASPLAEVRRRYGDAAVRDFLAYSALTWAARARANEAVWIYHEELLELCKLSVNKDNRRSAKERLERLGRTMMTARYGDRTIRGPLIQTSWEALEAGDGDGTEITYATAMALHPALFQGITTEDGSLGNCWWPSPIALVGAQTCGVHVLGVVLSNYWRASLPCGPIARIRIDTLADVIGVDRARRSDRAKDPRAVATITRMLNDAVKCGLAQKWEYARDDVDSIDSLSSVVLVYPSTVGDVPRPAWVPSTGCELAQWMKNQDMTGRELSAMIGVSQSQIAKSTATSALPILPGVRAAIRSHLRRQQAQNPLILQRGGGCPP